MAGSDPVNPPLDYFDHLALVEPYMPVSARVPEVIEFECRLAMLVWLHHTVNAAIEAEDHRLREIMRQGTHRVSGWEGESDMMLNDSILILQQDAAPVSAGAILAASCSALESMLTALLPGRSLRGLMPKAQALADIWPDSGQAERIREAAKWLAERRNSFAHRLIDEGGPWDDNPNSRSFVFDDEAVEEAFECCGMIATLIDYRYDEFVRRRDSKSANC
ncbi:hypothetical protein IU474_16785 [Nocardia otitidiscaviarum]|uniref:hypothetical protein n=1 Tax=Nocardia otitidiscaviarum TaxID=1823 RepID=UPI00189475E9|nr:hypothetical protein [Nocardia otitidiscaviarum]MBF6238707.1 hypothetical protein [Nocardia otitidiscaviarum]